MTSVDILCILLSEFHSLKFVLCTVYCCVLFVLCAASRKGVISWLNRDHQVSFFLVFREPEMDVRVYRSSLQQQEPRKIENHALHMDWRNRWTVGIFKSKKASLKISSCSGKSLCCSGQKKSKADEFKRQNHCITKRGGIVEWCISSDGELVRVLSSFRWKSQILLALSQWILCFVHVGSLPGNDRAPFVQVFQVNTFR